jgi:RNA polymerase sigma factor (TIGR02999 family)
MGEITNLIQAAREGDAQALGGLYERLYDDLHRLARAKLRQGGPQTSLDTTGLVHESFLRFVKLGQLSVGDRGHFMAYAARVMRSVVVDAARRRLAERRGGDLQRVTLDDEVAASLATDDDGRLLQVHEALEELGAIDARLAQVVEMRYFGGLPEAEIAQSLGLSTRTVERDWEKARLFLHSRLRA